MTARQLRTLFAELLKPHGIGIRRDGKGCWRDCIFLERLWRTIKYEEVYLRAYDSVSLARLEQPIQVLQNRIDQHA